MRWQSYPLKNGMPAQHTILSDRGYAVLRCTANGIPTGRFIAFVRRGSDTNVIGGYDSADEAKAACEHHAAQLEVV